MRRHPLLWKLALLQVGFCLLLTWLIYTWGLSVERSTYFLAPADRHYLADYARQAEDAWRSEGAAGANASARNCRRRKIPGWRWSDRTWKASAARR